jgi:2-octaprenylphenol hydroxylase
MKSYSVVIIGGGIVGLSLAALLAKHDFSVAVIESKKAEFKTDTLSARVSVIHLTSTKLLDYLGVWDALKHNSAPLYEMKIWDHTQNAHLHFDSRTVDQLQMGFIVDNQAITQSLRETLKNNAYVDIFCPAKPTAFQRENKKIILSLDNNNAIETDLIVGADGAHSWVREQMPITLKTRSYCQKAIIAVIESQKAHHNTAYQKFLTTGPVALLPLSHPHQTALVWSADDAISDELMAKSDEEFNDALTQALDFKLGKLNIKSTRSQFPLTMRHAEDYVSENFALAGDAAHTIHPLAGLGVNLGLMDVACLAQTLVDARTQKKSLGDLRVLRRYSRWRIAQNTGIISAMRGLKELFAVDASLFNIISSFGVNAVDQCAPIKNQLMQIAMGQSNDLPNFLQTSRFTVG